MEIKNGRAITDFFKKNNSENNLKEELETQTNQLKREEIQGIKKNLTEQEENKNLIAPKPPDTESINK